MISKALKLFGKRIEIFLAEKGMNQSDLARAAGLSRQQVSAYVSGKTPPGLEMIEKIAKALERPIADFFKEEVSISATSELLRLWQKADEDDRELVLRILRGDEDEVKTRDRGGASGA